MDFIRGQNTPYFSWDFDRYQNLIPGPLISYRVFREKGPQVKFDENNAKWSKLSLKSE